MEFRKMVTITLYTRQQKRHWCIEQSFGLGGRGRGWEDLGEWHWNMYNIMYEMSCQSRFNARYWMLGAGALGWPRGVLDSNGTHIGTPNSVTPLKKNTHTQSNLANSLNWPIVLYQILSITFLVPSTLWSLEFITWILDFEENTVTMRFKKRAFEKWY